MPYVLLYHHFEGIFNSGVIPQLFYKINENKSKRKINNDLAVVASHIPVGAIHNNQLNP